VDESVTIIMTESKLINGTIWNINHNGIMDDNGDHSFILLLWLIHIIIGLVQGKTCRKPWFLQLNMGGSCKFSLKPIQ
jgi:hypothetical protein